MSMKTFSRLGVFRRNVKFKPWQQYKVAVPTEVCIKNPTTGEDELHNVITFKEEPHIDPILKASDFALDVQIRHGVQLSDCGKYFEPSNPEEYVDMVSNMTSVLRDLSLKSSDQVSSQEKKQVVEQSLQQHEQL